MKDFITKNKEILVVNLIVLGFIAITLLAQFGVHVEVDREVELVPVEVGYSQSTRRGNSGKAAYVAARYVRFRYEDDARKPFWVPASVVYGRAGDDDIRDMIENGDSVTGNVFWNTSSDKVVGVTKHGATMLSLYYRNSKVFRYGTRILLIVDLFFAFLMKHVKAMAERINAKRKELDLSQYRYDPKDKRKLELREVLFRMKEVWTWYFLFAPAWFLWGIGAAAFLTVFSTEGATAAAWGAGITILFLLFLILLGAMFFVRHRAKKKVEVNRIVKNTAAYLPGVGKDFLERLQADLHKGLSFLKKRSLIISERYIICSVSCSGFDPIAIPKEQIKEISYAAYTLAGNRYVQEVYLRLKNGREVTLHVCDPGRLGLALRALEYCGLPVTDVSQERKSSR